MTRASYTEFTLLLRWRGVSRRGRRETGFREGEGGREERREGGTEGWRDGGAEGEGEGGRWEERGRRGKGAERRDGGTEGGGRKGGERREEEGPYDLSDELIKTFLYIDPGEGGTFKIRSLDVLRKKITLLRAHYGG
jgi:hypothetical protein